MSVYISKELQVLLFQSLKNLWEVLPLERWCTYLTQCQYYALALMERGTHTLDEWTSGGNWVPFEGFLKHCHWLILIQNKIYWVFCCKVKICDGAKHGMACQINNMRKTYGDTAWVMLHGTHYKSLKLTEHVAPWLNLIPHFFRLRSRDLRNVSLFVVLSTVIHLIYFKYFWVKQLIQCPWKSICSPCQWFWYDP